MVYKEELLLKFFELYRLYGFKSITVDDLAREAGVSKKTLYTHFKNRDDIIQQTLLLFIRDLKKIIASNKSNDNAISKLLKLYYDIINYLKNFNIVFFVTLNRFHKRSAVEIQKYILMDFTNQIKDIIRKGITEGLFSENLQIEHITHSHIRNFNMFVYENIPNENYSGMTAQDFFNLVILNIKGLTTLKGYHLINGMSIKKLP